MEKGHIHPISEIRNRVLDIFVSMGFEVALGPEVETEWNNFDALNVPKDHPARDMQDTFWLKTKTGEERHVLRTHTSPMQVRYMKTHTPPFAVVVPGKVFRYEATDATHEAQFHQCEGFVVGENITLANLKTTLDIFFKRLFGEKIKTRFRPGYFPFVEPGVEVDISCFKCEGKGCSICKESGWIEVMGAGMIHPSVLSNGKLHPRKWRGFAFGMGLDRLAMLKWGVPDVRLFYNGDARVINQF